MSLRPAFLVMLLALSSVPALAQRPQPVEPLVVEQPADATFEGVIDFLMEGNYFLLWIEPEVRLVRVEPSSYSDRPRAHERWTTLRVQAEEGDRSRVVFAYHGTQGQLTIAQSTKVIYVTPQAQEGTRELRDALAEYFSAQGEED